MSLVFTSTNELGHIPPIPAKSMSVAICCLFVGVSHAALCYDVVFRIEEFMREF